MPGIIGLSTRNECLERSLSEYLASHIPFTFRRYVLPSITIYHHSFTDSGIETQEECHAFVDGPCSAYCELPHILPELIQTVRSERGTPVMNFGNVALHDSIQDSTYVFADLLATVPLYYAQTDEFIAFSSFLRPLAYLTQASLDQVQLVQFLRDGYFIIGRSLFQGVHSLRPGEYLTIRHTSGSISARAGSDLWSRKTLRSKSIDPIHDIGTHIEEKLRKLDTPMLMMSGGWDSRTLLALSCKGAGLHRPYLYFHGDVQSRETQLVRELADISRCSLQVAPLSEECYTPQALQENLRYVENTIFPHWHTAGLHAREQGCQVVVSGVLGEALGGHYGPPMLLRGSQRALSLLAYLVGLGGLSPQPGEGVKELAKSLLTPKPISKPWCFDKETWDSLQSEFDSAVPEIVDNLVSEYMERGIDSPERIVEAFVTEHRGSKYINAQMLSCRHYVDVEYPFAMSPLIETATTIDFSAKVHNRLNQRLIAQYAPALLKPPTAAVLVSARSPILLQELSRATRKGQEILQVRLGSRTRFGWANLDFFNEQLLHQIVESLRLDLWDRAQMHNFITNRQSVGLHAVMDMLLKIMTADFLLSNYNGR